MFCIALIVCLFQELGVLGGGSRFLCLQYVLCVLTSLSHCQTKTKIPDYYKNSCYYYQGQGKLVVEIKSPIGSNCTKENCKETCYNE